MNDSSSSALKSNWYPYGNTPNVSFLNVEGDNLHDQSGMELLTGRSHRRVIKRRQYILQREQVCRHYIFVLEGCLRLFQLDKKDVEHNLLFAAENEWITDLHSFYTEKPSHFFIEAIEPSIILQIRKDDLLELSGLEPMIEKKFRNIAEKRMTELLDRICHVVSLNAEERYLAFITKNPALSARLPIKEIASLLGITPEFLSRVRKDMLTK